MYTNFEPKLQARRVYTTVRFFGDTHMKRKVFRQDTPPKAGPSHEVVRCDPGCKVWVQVLSERIWGCWTHWDGNRSRECTGEDGGCFGHSQNWPTRWKGYLYAFDPTRKQCVFVEITPAAAEEILRLSPTNGNLRGMVLKMERRTNAKRSGILVELVAPMGDPDKLPKPEDPEPILRKLWGWKDFPKPLFDAAESI